MEILFPEDQQTNYSLYIRKFVILYSSELKQICAEKGWDFTTLNFIKLVIGVQPKELSLIEDSLENADQVSKNKIFHFLCLFIAEDIVDKTILQENFSFYRALSSWVMKKFNE